MTKSTPFDADAFKSMEKRSWEQAADNYGETFGRITAQAFDPILDAVGAGTGVRLLDVCCGIGMLAAAAAKRGASPVGLDFATSMVAQARRLHPSLDIREGDAEALPFEDAMFDAVAVAFGIRHVPHPERLLEGTHRVLAAGGHLAFTDWYPASDERESFFRIVRDAVRAHGDASVVPPIPPPRYDFSDAETSRRLVQDAGFVEWESSEVPIVARWERAEQVLETIYSGMVRTRGIVESQPEAARERIHQAILDGARRFARDGRIEIPMPAVLVKARKT